MTDSVIPLKCFCNEYDWGKTGKDSLAARLCHKNNSEFQLKNDTDYAEMWMGTYPSLPSYSLTTGEPLQTILNNHSDTLIGSSVLSKFGTDLPFLPKILSIKKALPLQIHPSIPLAKKLHASNPDKFTDTNHKPEIAIALSQFELFVGFLPLTTIQTLFALPPLHHFVPESTSTFTASTLRSICRTILLADPATIKSTITALSSLPTSSFHPAPHIPSLLPRLTSQYPSTDPGTLIALLTMNYLSLPAGSSVYVPADGIHAYLHGDIVECMARSNNMLATGFCPQPDRDDVDIFTGALTFEQQGPEAPQLGSVESEKSKMGKTKAFKPPLSEFNMLVTELEGGDKETIGEIKGPSVMFVTQGKGKMVAGGKDHEAGEGSIFFIGQGVEVSLEGTGGSDEGSKFLAFRAYAE